MLVSGKITKKSVKSGEYGDKVSFLVGGNWLSAFAADKKLDQDTKDMLRSLTEGDEAEFNIVEAANKINPAKPYLNITGVIKVTRLDVPEVAPPSNRVDKPGESVDTRIRSMCVAYAKDLVVAGKIGLDEWVGYANAFEGYILGIE